MISSREKGKRGERAWAKVLTALGFPARRGVQFKGGPDSPDVEGGIPGTHAEVKCVEKLSIYQAMQQAKDEAPAGAVPYVAHKRNRKEWLVTVEAGALIELAKRIVENR